MICVELTQTHAEIAPASVLPRFAVPLASRFPLDLAEARSCADGGVHQAPGLVRAYALIKIYQVLPQIEGTEAETVDRGCLPTCWPISLHLVAWGPSEPKPPLPHCSHPLNHRITEKGIGA